MKDLVVISLDELRLILRDVVQAGVYDALANVMKNKSAEMTENEAAEYMGMSPQTLCNWRVQKRGPAYHKTGRAVRYSRKDIDEWLNKNRIATIDDQENLHGKI